MQVKFLIGANAYACITEAGISHDIRLDAGKSPIKSLREYAAAERERANNLLSNADRAERAAIQLELKA